MNLFKSLVLTAALCVPSFGATAVIESARSHAAAGAFGCTVSGATVATPSVITCAAAHNLIDGDQVQITGVGGTTTDNTLAYVKVTSYSATTFGLFSDAALTAGITGTGSYTSGGVVTMAFDISGWTADFTLKLHVDSLTAAKKVLLAVQDSVDGFVSDIKTLMVVNLSGTGPSNDYSLRGYQLPSARFGTSNARLRLTVQSIDGSAAVVTSFRVE